MGEPKVRLNLALSVETDAQLKTIMYATGENATAAIIRLIRQENAKIAAKLTAQEAQEGP